MTTPAGAKTFPSDEAAKIPRPFILRRLHSLLGVWLVIYLFEHLLVNSQAAFFIEDDGHGFVTMVNNIHAIPYLKAVELIFLGLPFAIHMWWGVLYLRTGKLNAHPTDGTKPALPQYKRNRAYSWQRITSWLLLVGIIAHVIHMRFLDYPTLVYHGGKKVYLTRVAFDPGIYAVADRLQVTLYTKEELAVKRQELDQKIAALEENAGTTEERARAEVQIQEDREWLEGADKRELKPGYVLAAAPDAGTAFFLIVRNTFKSPAMVVLYSILVLSAVYHAFNGVWTFMISWGITLTRRSQKRMRLLTNLLMIFVAFLGLIAAWGTYWTTLFQK